MRHKKGNKKLSKPTDQRIAMLRSLSEQLILNNAITTTDTRAAALVSYAGPLFRLAKKGDVNAIRHALKLLPNKDAIKKLFDTAKTLKERDGSYVAVTKLGFRKGDASPISKVEILS